MLAVLLDYADVLADDSGDLEKADKLQYTINTGDALPIRQPSMHTCNTVRGSTKATEGNGREDNYLAIKEPLGITSCTCEKGGCGFV